MTLTLRGDEIRSSEMILEWWILRSDPANALGLFPFCPFQFRPLSLTLLIARLTLTQTIEGWNVKWQNENAMRQIRPS
jgi:hypothetical protein